MPEQASTAAAVPARDEIDTGRALQWGALARLLVSAPDSSLLGQLSLVAGDATALGRAWTDLAAAARAADPAAVQREFFDLFVGVGRGELLPYASFYLTGFLNERPLADLRRDLAAMGVERAPGRHEPEDHIASLCDVMAGLAEGRYDAAVLGSGAAGEAGFFARHLEPWAGMFWDDLAAAPSAGFYRSVAAVGRIFTQIEQRAFALARGDETAGARAPVLAH